MSNTKILKGVSQLRECLIPMIGKVIDVNTHSGTHSRIKVVDVGHRYLWYSKEAHDTWITLTSITGIHWVETVDHRIRVGV